MAILERRGTGAIAHLHMNAPERLNALSDEMLLALQTEFDALKTDTSVRAIVLSGSGKAFCAGHDLKQMTAGRQNEDGGKAYFKDLFDRCAAMMQSMAASWSQAVIWLWRPKEPALVSMESISACFALHRWLRLAAISRARKRSRC